jgi:hypothetical protein
MRAPYLPNDPILGIPARLPRLETDGFKTHHWLVVAAAPLMLNHHFAGGRKKPALVAAEAIVDRQLDKRAAAISGYQRMLGVMEWEQPIIVA